jgi:hypothetical protein
MNVLTIVLAIAIPMGIAALTAWISIKNGPEFRGPARKNHYFLAVSQTSASASSENYRQTEQDDCDRHKRRASDVSDQDEDDRDDGEDCCDVVVHSFSIVGLSTLRCEPTPCRLCNGAQVA